MKSYNIATGILAVSSFALVSGYTTSCYKQGLSMVEGDLIHHSKRACQGYDGKKGAFQGTFGPKEVKKACVNNGVGKIVMEVGNLDARSKELNDADCSWEFFTIAEDCMVPIPYPILSYGGRRTPGTGWTFRIDPNDGKC